MEDKALTSRLSFSFDYEAIEKDYDFFILTTSERYIDSGANILDDNSGRLPIVSLAFDWGRSLWMMFHKGDVGVGDIVSFLNEKLGVNNNTFTVTKSVPKAQYILLRLFLYSLSTPSGMEYRLGNLTGKLYLSSIDWINKDGTFNALQIDVDKFLNLTAVFSTFTNISKFKRHQDIVGLPMYTFSGKGDYLCRAFSEKDAPEGLYVKKPVRKGEANKLDFFNYDPNKRSNTKVRYLYDVLNELIKEYRAYFKNQPRFSELPVFARAIKFNDAKYMKTVMARFKEPENAEIVFVNRADPASQNVFDALVSEMSQALTDSETGEIKPNVRVGQRIESREGSCYVVMIESEDYYRDHRVADEYDKLRHDKAVVQAITVKDCEKLINAGSQTEDGNVKPFYRTILKELFIKMDLHYRHSIGIDDWSAYGFESNWVFGTELDGTRYLMRIAPDGSFKTFVDEDNFIFKKTEFPEINEAISFLKSSSEKTKTIVSDGQNTMIISQSHSYVMPSEEILKITERAKTKAIMDGMFMGNYGINIYKDGEKFLYSASAPGQSFYRVATSTQIYKIDTVKGKCVIDQLLKTFCVPFVCLEQFSVLPYPFKYLREFADMYPKKNVKK